MKTCKIISRQIPLSVRNVSDKTCRENQNTHFVFSNFCFRKERRLWDNVEKYCGAGQVTDENIVHAYCMLGTLGRKYILIICTTYCLSTATMVTRTCFKFTLYVQCLSCLFFPFCQKLCRCRERIHTSEMESAHLCVLRLLWWESSASGRRTLASVFPNTTAFSSYVARHIIHHLYQRGVACDNAFMINKYCEGSRRECSPNCRSNTHISNFTLERSVHIILPRVPVRCTQNTAKCGIFPVRESGISVRLRFSWWGPLHKRWENQLSKYPCTFPTNPHYFTTNIFH